MTNVASPLVSAIAGEKTPEGKYATDFDSRLVPGEAFAVVGYEELADGRHALLEIGDDVVSVPTFLLGTEAS